MTTLYSHLLHIKILFTNMNSVPIHYDYCPSRGKEKLTQKFNCDACAVSCETK